ncbi:MAG: copper transporter [Actinomycetota bacterium]
MISFRFHLVSLVGVFLALGLGVLTGTTVLNRGIVAQLENQTDRLAADSAGLREDVEELVALRDLWAAFGEEAREPLLAGRLGGSRVVVIAQDGTDDESIDGVLAALRAAAATPDDVVGPITVTGRLSLRSESDRAELARIVGEEGSEDADLLRARAAGLLADRLSFGLTGGQVLEELLGAGFLIDEGRHLEEADLRAIGGPGQVVLALAGGPATSALPPERFLIPLVENLAGDDALVAAGEPVDGEEEEPPFVSILRSDGDLASRIATQDNLDQIFGQIGMVVAIEDLLGGVAGHYGVKDGATRPFPEL